MDFLKYLKVLIYILAPVLILNFILSLLYYFNLIGSGIINYLKLFVVTISMLIGGIYIGRRTSKNGWLEGLKVGAEVIVLFFIVSYLAFDKGINIKTIIYYFILIAASILGSMIGINKKKLNK
ncbi:MAG: TIGR04086 family membrane protein [Tenericutes bacterium]|nr:TIGR04086 family membrane protein [Mycoplasmatota bacterium]